MPQTPDREGQLVGCLHAIGHGGGACGFPTPTEEAVLLEEDQTPQEAQATSLYAPIYPEEASEPEVAISFGGDGRCTEVVTTNITRVCRAAGY